MTKTINESRIPHFKSAIDRKRTEQNCLVDREPLWVHKMSTSVVFGNGHSGFFSHEKKLMNDFCEHSWWYLCQTNIKFIDWLILIMIFIKIIILYWFSPSILFVGVDSKMMDSLWFANQWFFTALICRWRTKNSNKIYRELDR